MNNNNNNKRQLIERAITTRNLWQLREYALSDGGLLDDSLRKKAWPLLVDLSFRENTNVTTNNGHYGRLLSTPLCPSKNDSSNEQQIKVIEWDVARLVTKNDRNQLVQIIINTINIEMYYQGYHTIVNEILTLLDHDEVTATIMLQQSVTLQYLWNIQTAVETLRNIIPNILLQQLNDIELYNIIQEVDPAVICLPWILTWFNTNNNNNQGYSTRQGSNHRLLWDAFLSSHPLFTIYYSITLLRYYRNDIIHTYYNEQEDSASLYTLLQSLPIYMQNQNIEEQLVKQTLSLLRRFPILQETSPSRFTTMIWHNSPNAWIAAGYGGGGISWNYPTKIITKAFWSKQRRHRRRRRIVALLVLVWLFASRSPRNSICIVFVMVATYEIQRYLLGTTTIVPTSAIDVQIQNTLFQDIIMLQCSTTTTYYEHLQFCYEESTTAERISSKRANNVATREENTNKAFQSEDRGVEALNDELPPFRNGSIESLTTNNDLHHENEGYKKNDKKNNNNMIFVVDDNNITKSRTSMTTTTTTNTSMSCNYNEEQQSTSTLLCLVDPTLATEIGFLYQSIGR